MAGDENCKKTYHSAEDDPEENAQPAVENDNVLLHVCCFISICNIKENTKIAINVKIKENKSLEIK